MSDAIADERAPAKAVTRDAGIDVARGLLMAYVIIIIHGMFWLRLVPQPQSSWVLFEMPLIFMVSGAAYYYGQIKWGGSVGAGARAYVGYLLSRGVRILAPYFVYAIVCAIIVISVRHLDAVQTFRFWLDPYLNGFGHSFMYLSAHLWFVSPFLCVTALLPFFARLPAWTKAPLWVWAIVGALIILAIDAFKLPSLRLVEMVVFYGLWALFGFGLVAAPRRFSTRDFVVLLVLALAVLTATLVLLPETVSINMQRNKFPPNAVFFVFSCVWVAAFMIGARSLKPAQIEALANFPPLKPFIRSGYSVYLWQGVGYTAAGWIGGLWGWNAWLVWPVGVVLTVVFGVLMSPVERIRLKRVKSATPAGRA